MWHLFSRFIIFKIFTYVYLCLYVYVYVFVCPQRPEEGAGGMGSHEPCDMDPGNRSFGRVASPLIAHISGSCAWIKESPLITFTEQNCYFVLMMPEGPVTFACLCALVNCTSIYTA